MNIHPAFANILEEAVRLLRAGALVAFPTETVYGLGADATNGNAVADIFALKGRPEFNPLIVHVSDAAMAQRYVQWNAQAQVLAERFWPGPLTLVLPRVEGCAVSLLASAGGDTLGIRLPAHPVARTLIAAAGIPIAAPSANRSGRVSPTQAAHVYAEFAQGVPLIIDGGACDVGIESTVLDISGEHPVVLRPGSVTQAALEEALQHMVLQPQGQGGTLKSPGLLASHYAPSLPVRLNVLEPRADEALLAFGAMIPHGAKTTVNLSVSGNLREAAARLFAALRELDCTEYAGIAVMPIPLEGLGIAINDRLQRAAAKR